MQVVPVGAGAARVPSGRPVATSSARPSASPDVLISRAQPIAGVRNPGLVALRLQRELSAKRVAAGQADAAMRATAIWSPRRRVLAAERDALQAQVETLMRREAEQARIMLPDVQKARFAVTLERLRALEGELGAEAAVRLARQTYYAGFAWDGVAAAGQSKPATRWELSAAGFPHGVTNHWNAAGGFDGDMRTPDGTPVDMGHMFCGVDWQVNDRHAHGAWSIESVTLGGDLGSAMANTLGASPDEARAAIAGEGDFDLNGDLDGLNLAKRLETHHGARVSDVLAAYYAENPTRTRVSEYASHGRWVARNSDGTPKRTRYGGYVLNDELLRHETRAMTRLIRVWAKDFSRVERAQQDAIIGAFGEWMRSH